MEMNLNPQHSVTDQSPEKSLSPSIVQQFNNISFQQSSQTHLFNHDTNTNNHHSPPSLPSKTFSNDPNNNSIISHKIHQNQHHSMSSQSDHASPPIPKPSSSQTIATNQENINPNPTHSPPQTTNHTERQSAAKLSDDKSPAKTKWKQEFNQLIRKAREHESKKEHILALKTFIKASTLGPKTYGKLLDKIERVQDKCYDRGLHETEAAFEQIGDTPWYLNIITDNYHIERDPKEDDDEEEGDWTEDDEELEYVLPGDIYDKLYDYQRECLVWFWKIYQSPNGGILGDDMGLGKTVQMSAFLHGAFLSGLMKCCLLIVPVSVMAHWIKELNIWCDAPGFRIRKYHSSITKKRRAEHLATIAKKGGVLITTYGMVQKNFAIMGLEEITKKVNRHGQVVREGRKWDYMVLDEGHKIKNHLIGTSKAVRQIPVSKSNKVILSGTFLQNELSELWSLFDFISEGALFGSYRAFNEEFATKINAGRLKNASLIQKQISNRLLNLIKKTVKPYLLRRTKAEIRQKQEENMGQRGKKGLTPVLQCQKRELVIWITMSSIQVDLYRTFLESDAVKETLNTTKSPLAALTVLKKICDHPFLLSDKMANCAELTRLQDITRDRSIANTLATSNKMHVLLAVVKHLIDNKHRILVFSQYKIILSMIEPILNENKIDYLRMDGDTPVDERQKFVDAFNKRNISVFLLSTRVGGLGLNLVGSDRVIIYDPAWNPATDAQAVDRSYRIGQVNDVMVYRFVTCGTIEEKIYRRQISKVGLLKSVTGRTNQHRYFSKAELKEVFKLENPQESQTQIQFKDLHAHRIGTNAAFDTESNYVEQIRHVYGISHHDLLFRTCPPEELEENPELAKHIEELGKKLRLQTPKPRTARKKKKPPQTNPKIEDILEGRLDLSRYKYNNNHNNHTIPNTNDHNKNMKRSTNDDYNPNHNILNSSTSMDIDDDEEEEQHPKNSTDIANVSFISNVSSIHSVHRHEDNSNSWTDNQVLQRVVNDQFHSSIPQPMSTAKKTRTLRKKQNRFIADSDTDDEENDNGFNAFPATRPQFDILSTNANTKCAPSIASNVILQTPIFQKHMKKTNDNAQPKANIMEENGIDMTDIVKVIRSQPKRKRKKSMANLKQLLDAQESEDDNETIANETNHNYDSEATVSEANTSFIPQHQDTQHSWQSGANHSALSQPSQANQHSNHSIFGAPKEASGSNSQSTSFIFDPNRTQSASYESKHNEATNQDTAPWQSGANHSVLSHTSHTQPNHHSNHSQSTSFTFDNHNNNMNRSHNNDNSASYDSKHNEATTAPSNPYLDDHLIHNLQPFSVKQNKSFEQMYRVNENDNTNAFTSNHTTQHNTNGNGYNNNNNQFDSSAMHGNINGNDNGFTDNNDAFDSIAPQDNALDANEPYDDDEETLSDEEMFDLSNEAHSNRGTSSHHASPSTQASTECIKSPMKSALQPQARQESVTALEIFESDEIEKTSKALSIEPPSVNPLQSVSPEKRKQIATNYKRYRRKSVIPRIEEYDTIHDEEEDDEETETEDEDQNEIQNNHNSVALNTDDNKAVSVCDKHRRRANGIESFEYKCVKCECYLTVNEKIEYERCIKVADEAEQKEDWTTAIEMTMNALTICNSDPALHAKCIAIADHLRMC